MSESMFLLLLYFRFKSYNLHPIFDSSDSYLSTANCNMLPTKPCLHSLSLRLTVKARARPPLFHAGVVFAVSAVFVARAAVCWAVMAVRFFYRSSVPQQRY